MQKCINSRYIHACSIHYSWDRKFVDKANHENNENWIPTNKKYFTVCVPLIVK